MALGGGAGDPEGSEAPSVSAVGSDGGEAGLPGQDGRRGGVKIVRRPSLDSVPEAIHPSERSLIRGEEVGPISQYGEESSGSGSARGRVRFWGPRRTRLCPGPLLLCWRKVLAGGVCYPYKRGRPP